MRILKRRRRRIFISYSHEDVDLAKDLARELEKPGHEVWFDKRSRPLAGGRLSQEIKEAIKRSDLFLVVISDHSEDSTWVRLELIWAREHRRKIVPVVHPDGGNSENWRFPSDLRLIDFRNVPFARGVEDIFETAEHRRFASIGSFWAIILGVICVALMSSVLAAFYLLHSEMMRIDQVQKRVQKLEDRIHDEDFDRREEDHNTKRIRFFAGQRLLVVDEFDAATRRIITRSFYDDNHRRIAIDRFEWAEAEKGPVRKRRTHYDERGDEFLRESFSSTGKLEIKEHDEDRNDIFIEREADFVSPFPAVVMFPVPYR